MQKRGIAHDDEILPRVALESPPEWPFINGEPNLPDEALQHFGPLTQLDKTLLAKSCVEDAILPDRKERIQNGLIGD